MTLSEEDLLVIQAADDGASVLFGVILTNLLVIILNGRMIYGGGRFY